MRSLLLSPPFPYTTLFRSMSPGFQMLIRRGLMQLARTPRLGIQLVRLRSQEREIVRQLIEHTPQDEPGRARMISRTHSMHVTMANTHMLCGRPSVKSLLLA